ncbi:hypothetical protein H012_gp434 [Acanthamoeba polyphaga moumouvirus]|uniref:Uncharacterized protein n=1 Tax=Acanthamoeba polyphaga moumouvirus TaxID=1269028 RepID=L7RG68_9VIRU|nr:hypothetical protein H012_gp434 [Acanthamoeba polyphaga moumouvirus]AGC02025.1 hypothetical protein Moumou_00491 [Acanthamoeba polyphaga moumouvirus]
MRNNYKEVCVKRYIHENNLITAECYARNFNMILGNSGYVFNHEKYVFEYSYYDRNLRKYVYIKKINILFLLNFNKIENFYVKTSHMF